MPRQARYIEPGIVYHLIPRFIEKKWFIRNAQDRADYLRLLGHALKNSDWRCLAYTLMNSHQHIPLIAGEQPMDEWLRKVHTPFADSVNARLERIGPVFVRGPSTYATPKARVGELIAYVHNNPVRAGVVDDPVDSSWTSHRAYLGLEEPPPWLDVEAGLALAGFSSPHEFAKFVALAPDDPTRSQLDRSKPSLASTDEEWRASGRPRPPEIDASELVSLVASELSIAEHQLRSRRRGCLSSARRIAARCAATLNVPGNAVAAALGVTQQAVSAMQSREVRPEEASVVDKLCSYVLGTGTQEQLP